MSTRILATLALLVLFLGGVWVVVMHRQVPQHRSPFADIVDRTDGIRLQKSGHSIFLKRENGWMVSRNETGPFFTADAQRTESLLEGFRNLQLEDVISERADRAADFEVDDSSGLRATLSDRSKTVLAEGIFGKPGTSYGQLYFRLPGQTQVWLARGIHGGELGGMDFNGWRDHALVNIPEPAIQSVQIRGRGFETSLTLSSTTWLVGGKLADAGKVNTLLGAASHLRAIEFADPILVSSSGPWVSSVLLKSSTTAVTLQIGTLDAKTKRVPVMRSAEEGVAWVEDSRIQAILVKPSDLQVK